MVKYIQFDGKKGDIQSFLYVTVTSLKRSIINKKNNLIHYLQEKYEDVKIRRLATNKENDEDPLIDSNISYSNPDEY